MKNVGVVILAGGKSRRMGVHKANLKIAGETFLSRICGQLNGFDEVLLSVDQQNDFKNSGLVLVEDIYPDSGPIGGIYSALNFCRSPYLLAISCDIPLFNAGLAEFLLSYVTEGYDAFAAVTRDGHIHPLCCVYAKSALPMLQEKLLSGDLRLLDALKGLKTKKIMMKYSAYADETLYNVNNHAQYIELCRRIQGLPIIAISGVKNSGKTTLLSRLIPHLKQRGLKLAVAKHDSHGFIPDMCGTDSYKLRQAGADLVAVYSDDLYMVTAKQNGRGLESLLKYCRDMDLLILEGGKYTAYPKIELVRTGISATSVCDKQTLLALCTDTDLNISGVPTYRLDDYEGIADLLRQYIQRWN